MAIVFVAKLRKIILPLLLIFTSTFQYPDAAQMVTAVDHTHVYNTTVFRFVHRRCPSVERAPNAMVSTTKLFANVHRDTEAIQGSLASFLVARVTLIVPRTKPASTIAARIPASKILALEIWIATFIITWWNVLVLLATSRILKRAALNVGIIN